MLTNIFFVFVSQTSFTPFVKQPKNITTRGSSLDSLLWPMKGNAAFFHGDKIKHVPVLSSSVIAEKKIQKI